MLLNTKAMPNTRTPQPTRLDETHLQVLRAIELHPKLTQRQLAAVLGVSLGKAHYCMKAVIDKGLVKMGNFSHNQHKLDYAYLLTPKGIKSKTALTLHFLERKAAEYEQLKTELEGHASTVDLKTLYTNSTSTISNSM